MSADRVDALVIFGATGERYPRGSWGPPHADALVPGGEAWHNSAA